MPWSWKTPHSECLQIFAASCQEPLPLAAHSESLVMCIFHLFSEATQWSLDFLEPVNSAADENWSSPQTSFQCSSLLSDTFTKTWSGGLSCVFVVSRLPAIVVDGSKSFSFPCIRTLRLHQALCHYCMVLPTVKVFPSCFRHLSKWHQRRVVFSRPYMYIFSTNMGRTSQFLG